LLHVGQTGGGLHWNQVQVPLGGDMNQFMVLSAEPDQYDLIARVPGLTVQFGNLDCLSTSQTSITDPPDTSLPKPRRRHRKEIRLIWLYPPLLQVLPRQIPRQTLPLHQVSPISHRQIHLYHLPFRSIIRQQLQVDLL